MTSQNCHRSSALLFMAALAGPASLLAQFSSPIHDVENPAHSVMRFSGQVSLAAGFSLGAANLGVVPLGKRMVIEHASVRCTIDSSPGIDVFNLQLTAYEVVGTTLLSHFYELPFTKAGVAGSSAGYYTSHSLRLYSDGNSVNQPLQIFVSLTGNLPPSGAGSCGVELSGYTVNLP
jgi:hypothetical protein